MCTECPARNTRINLVVGRSLRIEEHMCVYMYTCSFAKVAFVRGSCFGNSRSLSVSRFGSLGNLQYGITFRINKPQRHFISFNVPIASKKMLSCGLPGYGRINFNGEPHRDENTRDMCTGTSVNFYRGGVSIASRLSLPAS